MLRRIALGMVAGLGLAAGVAAPAFAADVARPIVVPPPVVVVDYFSGPYIGLHGGWGQSDADSAYVDNDFNPPYCGNEYFWGCPVDVDPAGAFVGGQIGWNHVLGSGLMVGVEADWSAASLHDSGVGAFWYDNFATEVILNVDQLATIQARLGWVMGRHMPFFTIGWGWAHAERSAFNTDFIGPTPNVDKRWHQGLTLGGGLEYAINQNWTIKGEYRFFNGNTQTYSLAFADGTNVDLDIHTVRFGINFGF
jgi:outer membrane immunogenic protein